MTIKRNSAFPSRAIGQSYPSRRERVKLFAMGDIASQIEQEARAAAAALPQLTDARVESALADAASRIVARADAVLAANRDDVAAAETRLDEGALDRLRLDDDRLAAIGEQLHTLSELPPLEREISSWTLDNGLDVSERRIPIGVVGANFEARPNVAVDVAGQLLKSRNAALLRTGGAALRTVTAIVDEVLRPALAAAGLPPGAVGLVRSADRAGARALVMLPRFVPLVILRGSGETTAALARLAAEHGVRTLAHAEGGGVLYVHGAADPEKARALIEASLDRLGVCNRLNLLLVDRSFPLDGLLEAVARAGVQQREPPRLGHEWANDPDHVASVTVHVVDAFEEALAAANEETSGLAAAIVTEDEDAAARFLDGYRGTAAFWQAPTRFTDGFALTGAPETGINVDWVPGPRGPVTYHDLWLRQYVVVARRRRNAGLHRLVGSRCSRPAANERRASPAQPSPSAGRVRARPATPPPPLGGRARGTRRAYGAGAPDRGRDRRSPRLRQCAQHAGRAPAARCRAGGERKRRDRDG
jgi:glutamate-5-semialdehyde dehydrogenase